MEDVSVEVNGSGVPVKANGIISIPPEDTSAYIANYKAHKDGISHEEMIKAYSDWANNYDKDLCIGRYNGPEIMRDALAKFYPGKEERAQIRILDVAAGTGRVGHNLAAEGFKNIDALEPAEGMMNVLNGRGIYKVQYNVSIGFGPISDIPAETYDCLVIAGGMGEGHIPVAAFNEMIRIVRKGGSIFIVMREEYLEHVKEYAGLEGYMEALEMKGLWKKVSRTVVPNYSFKKNGVLYNYIVL